MKNALTCVRAALAWQPEHTSRSGTCPLPCLAPSARNAKCPDARATPMPACQGPTLQPLSFGPKARAEAKRLGRWGVIRAKYTPLGGSGHPFILHSGPHSPPHASPHPTTRGGRPHHGSWGRRAAAGRPSRHEHGRHQSGGMTNHQTLDALINRGAVCGCARVRRVFAARIR